MLIKLLEFASFACNLWH